MGTEVRSGAERGGWPLAVLAVLACLVAFPGNGEGRPLVAHEIFVARTSTEMLRRGEWIVPWFNDRERLEKPPLSYWLSMGAHLASGGRPEEPVGAEAARFPQALAAVLLVLLTARLGRRITGDRRVGLAAGAMLATSLGLFTYAGSARPEMLYALFCTLMVYGFVEVQLGFDDERARRRAGWLAWLGGALAMLSKGPFLVVFLLVGIALAIRGRRPLPAFLQPLKGLLLAGGVTALYFGEVARRVPWALDLWATDMFEDSGSDDSIWLQPLKLYYVLVGPTLLLPWVPLLPPAVARVFRRRREMGAVPQRLLLFATLSSAFFLSLSSRPHAYYLLPCVAPLFVLMADWAVAWFDRGGQRRDRRMRLWTGIGAGLVLAGALYLGGSALNPPAWAPAGGVRPAAVLAVSALALGAAVTAWRAASRGGALAALVVGLALLFGGFKLTERVWSSSRYTEAAFAAELARTVPKGRPVLYVGGAWETVVNYADRPVRRVSGAALTEALEEHPNAVVLSRERNGKRREALAGEILVRERWREDPSVLVDPSTGL